MRRDRKSKIRRERMVMLASSALVMGALTLTGIYMKDRSAENIDDVLRQNTSLNTILIMLSRDITWFMFWQIIIWWTIANNLNETISFGNSAL